MDRTFRLSPIASGDRTAEWFEIRDERGTYQGMLSLYPSARPIAAPEGRRAQAPRGDRAADDHPGAGVVIWACFRCDTTRVAEALLELDDDGWRHAS